MNLAISRDSVLAFKHEEARNKEKQKPKAKLHAKTMRVEKALAAGMAAEKGICMPGRKRMTKKSMTAGISRRCSHRYKIIHSQHLPVLILLVCCFL